MIRLRLCHALLAALLAAASCTGGPGGDPAQPASEGVSPPVAPPAREKMVRIRAGNFYFGLTEAQFQFFLSQTVMNFPGMIEQMRERIAIPPREKFEAEFYIHRFEVTNGDFKKFLDATSYQPSSRRDFLRHWTGGQVPDWAGDFPVTWVSGEDAAAYCRWAGGELPSETQWEKAARGTTDARAFPWGEDPPGPSLVNNASGKAEPAGDRAGDISPFQVYDLGGNVSEFTRSSAPGKPDEWIIRGGSFLESSRYALVGVRLRSADSGQRFQDVGFRCVAY